MTNGSGMVQFSRGFMLFAKNLPIVPVALRVTVPWNIQTHTLTSSFAANLFWFCFVPWVRLDATVLTPMSLAKVRARIQCKVTDSPASAPNQYCAFQPVLRPCQAAEAFYSTDKLGCSARCAWLNAYVGGFAIFTQHGRKVQVQKVCVACAGSRQWSFCGRCPKSNRHRAQGRDS